MTPERHLSSEELLALAERGPTAGGTARLTAHLDRCAGCEADRRDLAALVAYLRDPAAEPPAGVVARAWALMEPRPPRAAEARRFRRADLVRDSGDAPPRAGLRGPEGRRRRVWRAPLADVEVSVEGAGLGSPASLTGQILSRHRRWLPREYGTVWLVERGRPPRWSLVGPRGEFTMSAPRGPRWSLWLECGPLRLRLDSA